MKYSMDRKLNWNYFENHIIFLLILMQSSIILGFGLANTVTAELLFKVLSMHYVYTL